MALSFNAYTADPTLEEPGCVNAAALFNAEQRAALAGDPVALAAYVDVTPKQYTVKRFQGMMRSWTRGKLHADAAATAAATVAANPIPDP